MDRLVYYNENPNLGKRTVTTVNNDTEYRENCKRIKGEYHVMYRDCFPISGTWYRVASNLIEYDHETKEWFLKKEMSPCIMEGVVDAIAGKLVMGWFTINPYNNCKVYQNGRNYMALNKDVLERGGFKEDLSSGVYYHTRERSEANLSKIVNSLDHTGKGYNIEDNKAEYKNKRTWYDKYDTPIRPEIGRFAHMLGDVTFGAELEAAKGYMPDNLQARMGVVVCRDGSLKDEAGMPGPEFVTIPLQGAKGVQTLANIGAALTPRTVLDIKCSYHIHLGTLDLSPKYLVALFRLGYKIQNELFLMFPYYKANPDGIKNKNYNQKLPCLVKRPDAGRSLSDHVKLAYRNIFQWLSGGHVPDDFMEKKTHRHPQTHKWDRTARYYWMNLMNTIFSSRGTVEFRPHTPTTNPTKLVNWLYICTAIVRYAQAHEDEIITSAKAISLDKVLDYYADTFGGEGRALSEYLKAYVQGRKERFFQDYTNGDKISGWEIEQDKAYHFGTEDVKSII